MTFVSRILQIAIAYLRGKTNYIEGSVSAMKEVSYIVHKSSISKRKMNGLHLAQKYPQKLFFLRFGANVKKNALDMAAKRATIVI